MFQTLSVHFDQICDYQEYENYKNQFFFMTLYVCMYVYPIYLSMILIEIVLSTFLLLVLSDYAPYWLKYPDLQFEAIFYTNKHTRESRSFYEAFENNENLLKDGQTVGRGRNQKTFQ